jgi:hypothetical protein
LVKIEPFFIENPQVEMRFGWLKFYWKRWTVYMVKKPLNTLGTPFTKFLLLFSITLKLSKSIHHMGRTFFKVIKVTNKIKC